MLRNDAVVARKLLVSIGLAWINLVSLVDEGLLSELPNIRGYNAWYVPEQHTVGMRRGNWEGVKAGRFDSEDSRMYGPHGSVVPDIKSNGLRNGRSAADHCCATLLFENHRARNPAI